MSTSWPARQVGMYLVCGRKVGERYVCQGSIALVYRGSTGPVVHPPKGMTEDPPGSGTWRLTTRAMRKADESVARTRVPAGAAEVVRAYTTTNARHKSQHRPPTLPWRRACPHCGFTAEVTEAVLHSSQNE